MGLLVFFIFLSQIVALLLLYYKKGSKRRLAVVFRVLAVVFGLSVFAYWLVSRSFDKFSKNTLAVQVINYLPQPIDFYFIKVENFGPHRRLSPLHIGKIRSEHYRLEYLDSDNSQEFWLAGYLGKKNMVYYSQHAVPNKNIDQVVEVRNYINQSMVLSAEAKKSIDAYLFSNIKMAVWVTLDLLLILLNIMMLWPKRMH